MLKKDFPIYFDDTKLFWPVKWDESYEVVESNMIILPCRQRSMLW